MGRKKGETCKKSPGASYPTRERAQEAVLTRRINAANSRQVVHDGDYHVKGCACGGFHVFTAGQAERRRKHAGRGR
ncbi:MAG: hypothetical protein HOY78_02255 [Saccharothrix sp.]|nr:hypothetical protein [Saccharothrix sp.]